MGATIEGVTISAEKNAAFPGTPQELLTLLIDHMLVTGIDDVSGFIISQTEPSSDESDKIWVKTDGSNVPISFNYYLGDWNEMPLPPALLVRTANTIMYWDSVGALQDLSHPSTDPNPVTPAVIYFDENKGLAVKQLEANEAVRVGSGGALETFITTGIPQIVHLHNGRVPSINAVGDVIVGQASIDLSNFQLDSSEALNVDLSVQYGVQGATVGTISLNLNGAALITYNVGANMTNVPLVTGHNIFHQSVPFVEGTNALTVTRTGAASGLPYLHGAQIKIYRTL